MTEEVTKSVKDALQAFEALKSDILPIKEKLDGFDKEKLARLEKSIGDAVELNQKAEGERKLLGDRLEASKSGRRSSKAP